MSVFEDLGPKPYVSGFFAAVVSQGASAVGQRVSVVIPAFTEDLAFHRCRWMPNGSGMPTRGDDCLIVQDNNREWWIVSWWREGNPPALPLGSIADASIDGRKINWHEGSSPPSSPTINDVWTYHPVTGVSWTFRYEPDQDATYPWQFIGGGWIRQTNTGIQNLPSSVYADFGTPVFLTPGRKGVYTVRFGLAYIKAINLPLTDAYLSIKFGSSGPSDNNYIAKTNVTGGEWDMGPSSECDGTITGDSDTIRLQGFHGAGGGTSETRRQWLSAQPIRVG